jgi:ankyrin repeat protein
MDPSSVCATMKLGDLVHSGPLFEWSHNSVSGWRSSPRVGVLGRAGFAVVRAESNGSASVTFKASSLENLRVKDLLADPRALAAGALNAFEVFLAAPSSSPSVPTRLSVVASDADSKSEWLGALFGALCDAASPDLQMEKGWAHAIVSGTLHSAAATNDAETVRLLARFTSSRIDSDPLPAGIDLPPVVDANSTDAEAATPLHIAATFGHADAISALLEASADVYATNSDGDTPLHCAIAAASPQAALVLTVNGAPQEALSLLGATPLASLLTLPCLLDARNDDEEPAKSMRGVAEALLSHNAPSRDADGEGFAPIHRAAMLYSSSALVKALARKGADLNARALVSNPDSAEVRRRAIIAHQEADFFESSVYAPMAPAQIPHPLLSPSLPPSGRTNAPSLSLWSSIHRRRASGP